MPRVSLSFILSLLLSLTGGCEPNKDLKKDARSELGNPAPQISDSKASLAQKPPPADVPSKETSVQENTQVPPEDLPPTDVPRVYAKSRHVWIRSMPSSDVQWIGYLWWGGSVAIRKEASVPGTGCGKEWVPIEPRGWVCVDGEKATTDPRDPSLLSIYPFRPRIDSPWPHKYANIHGPLRRYELLPDEVTQKTQEVGYDAHLAAVRKFRETGSNDDLPEALAALDPSLPEKEAPALLPLPAGLTENHIRMVDRSAMSYSIEALHGNRGFLLTGDLNWVPKDRVELLQPSQFQGIELGEKLHLPLAFFRVRDRPGYIKNVDGSFSEVPDKFKRHSVVQLTGELVTEGLTKYYKVQGQELWVSSGQSVIPTPRTHTPWGAEVGKEDVTGLAPRGRGTWLEASIIGGWLVAFEGTRAVYATMISAGRGGTPQPGKTALETAATPTGKFPIGGKFKTATMLSSSTPIVHEDVPWTQNFSGPHAIHSAYWHDDWGNLKSAGCVNVAPRDGKWLFEFTEPDVPEGWHGVRYVSRYGGGSTQLIIHE